MADIKYERLHHRYISKMNALKEQKEIQPIAEGLKNGRTHVLKMKRLESSSFDMTWIKEIEDSLFDLGDIVKNPRRVTKTVADIVPVELARKTGAESVMHLASHTNYIKEVKGDDVIPSKILNLGSDDDIATYENRFVATVIRRLILFVEKRYDYVAHFAPITDSEVLMIKNKSVVNGIEIEVETKVKVTRPSITNEQLTTDYIERIKEIRKYLRFYYNSDFMKALKPERDVRNPILQTNIIRKNPEYNHIYRLYRFLETYDKIGVSYKVKETYENLNEEDFEEINSTVLANFLALNAEDPRPTDNLKSTQKSYKPRILTSMDDEMFNYGPLVRGPIQFVRMDQEYIDYMSKKIPLPEHMNNHERIYYEDEIAANREKASDLKELHSLIKRKKTELRDWEKYVASTLSQREKDKEIERRIKELQKLQNEEALLQAARNRLAEEAVKSDYVADQPVKTKKPVKSEEELAAEAARKAAEKAEKEAARKAAQEERARQKAAEKAAKKAEEERLKREAEEAARKAEEERLAREEAERKAAEEKARLEAEEAARKAEEERLAKEEAERQAKLLAEQKEARRIAREEAAKRKAEREEAKRKAELAAKRKAYRERKKAEEAARKAEEERLAKEEAERLAREEAERKAAEEEAARQAALLAEQKEARRIAHEEAAKRRAEREEAKRKTELAAKRKAYRERKKAEEAARKAEEEAAAKKAEEERKAREKAAKPAPQKIPGVFIVKTPKGYYVSERYFSDEKSEAKIFYDFNEANNLKSKHGGKVVKLN